jgi:hypothetical protein
MSRHSRAFTLACGMTLLMSAVFVVIRSGQRAKTAANQGTNISSAIQSNAASTTSQSVNETAQAVAPFIVTDTQTDSPGTNLETRVVTFTAKMGGTPAVRLQWQVDRGNGFVPVSATASNPVLVIPNARVTDTGSYALFASNSVGSLHTTPMPLVVVEGAD